MKIDFFCKKIKKHLYIKIKIYYTNKKEESYQNRDLLENKNKEEREDEIQKTRNKKRNQRSYNKHK